MKERFEDKVIKIGECWIWNAGKYGNNYGAFYYNGKQRLAHRASYMIYVGEIPDGMCVCHRCDVHECVNPEHLFLGTLSDNMQDCKRKGRSVNPVLPGETNGRAKLTAEQVVEIMSRIKSGETQISLSKEFGITQASISLIVRGVNWRCLGLFNGANQSVS